MSIIVCKKCGKKYLYDYDKMSGKKVNFKCAECGSPVKVENGDLHNNVRPAVLPDIGVYKRLGRHISSIRGRMFVLFLFIPVTIMIIAGFLSQARMQKMGNEILQESSTTVRELAEKNMNEISKAVAMQAKLYLDAHPGLKGEQFSNDPQFVSIVMQKVAVTGYTGIYADPDSKGVWRVLIHPNNKLIGTDLRKAIEPILGEHFDKTWKIIVNVLLGGYKRVSQGYYKWPDADGAIRDKFMVNTPLKGYPYNITCTAYIDEFTKPVEIVKENARKTILTSKRINNFILISTILVISVSIVAYGHRLSKRIRYLADIADRISMGELGTMIEVRGKDEISELATSISRMQNSLKISLSMLKQQH